MKVTLSDREGFAAFLLRARSQGYATQALFGAIEATPRRAFVPPEFGDAAYSHRSVPIKCGETLEGLDLQARMIAALGLEKRHRVLEIGTGSGFATAVMARLAGRVVSLERYRTLAEDARQRLAALGLGNAVVRQADATALASDDGTYDRVIAWGAFETVPRGFVDLLTSHGIMVTAIGAAETEQRLARLTRVGSRFEREDIGTVRFQLLSGGLAQVL